MRKGIIEAKVMMPTQPEESDLLRGEPRTCYDECPHRGA